MNEFYKKIFKSEFSELKKFSYGVVHHKACNSKEYVFTIQCGTEYK